MKIKGLRGLVLILVVVSVAPHDSGKPIQEVSEVMSCDALLRLIEVGSLAAADSALQATLKAQDQASVEGACLNGVGLRLAHAYRHRGDALESLGALQEAERAYERALSLRPELIDQIRHSLEEVQRTRQDPFTPVRQLASLGETSAARAKLEQLLTADDSALVVPEDLRHLHGGRWGWWRSLRSAVLLVLPTLVEIGVTLLLVVLALLVLPRAVRWVVGLCRRKLVVGKVVSGGEIGSGGGFDAMMRRQILELTRANPERSIALVTAAGKDVAIPDVVGQASTVSQGLTAIVSEVVKRLPLAPYQVTSSLHDPGRRGPGVTLHFMRGRGVLATTTLWQGTYAPPGQADPKGERASYYLLAELAAVWTLFQLKASRWWRFWRRFRMLGTDDWRAFAQFQAGIRAFEQGEETSAAYCFRMAKLQDPDFYAARFNLAKTLYSTDRKAAKEQFVTGLTVLTGKAEAGEPKAEIGWEQLWATLEQSAGRKSSPQGTEIEKLKGHRADAWYYKARYALLGLLVGELVEAWRSGGHRLDADSEELQRQLLGQLDRFAADLGTAARALDPAGRRRLRPWTGAWEAELRSTVRKAANAVEPVAVALEMLIAPDGYRTRLEALQLRGKEGSAHFCYNLACVLSLDAEGRQETAGDTVDAAVDSLLRAVSLEPFRKGQIATDALLVHLRRTDAYRELFTTAPEEKPTADGVADLDLVGEELARALGEREITTLPELLVATARHTRRRRLAVDLQVDEALALRWACLAELYRVGGLEAAAVNLLERAGVGSLAALSTSDVKPLTEHLTALSKVLGVEVAIDQRTVLAWIERAGEELPTMVEDAP